MKIYAPNTRYNGVTAGVLFKNGEADTTDKAAQKWLLANGYSKEPFEKVAKAAYEDKVAAMTEAAKAADEDKKA